MNKRLHKVHCKLFFGYSEATVTLDAESEQLVQNHLKSFDIEKHPF